MKHQLGFAVIIIASLSQPLALAAQSLQKAPDGTVEWKAGVDGVQLDFGAEGKVKKIYSEYREPVTIPDREGIRTAQVIAEEKAKGAIIDFLEQQVATGRAVTQFESTASNTTQSKVNGTSTLSNVNKRQIVQSLNEFSGSVAQGNLRGVVVLEQGFDKATQEVWVVVGLSDKTIAASQAAREMLSGKSLESTQAQHGTGDGGRTLSMPSEVRRGNTEF